MMTVFSGTDDNQDEFDADLPNSYRCMVKKLTASGRHRYTASTAVV